MTDEQINAKAEDWLNISAAIPEAKLFRDFARAIESAVAAPLLAQIAALEAQLKTEQCLSFRDQVAQLEAQLAEAKKDAERLDWLDEQNAELEKDGWVVLGHDCAAEDDYKKYWVGADLRAAIDAAIAQEQRNTNGNRPAPEGKAR